MKVKMHNFSDTRLVVLPPSGHQISEYDPSVVIENIRRVVFPDVENTLRKKLQAQGVDSCIALYKKLKTAYPKEYMLERYLNTLGYEVLNNSNTQDAVKLFSLNVSMYPTSFNVYDSLGEALMDAGNKEEAIKNYEKSLALNPGNTNAVDMLKKLKGN